MSIKTKGFTLTELLITVAILGVLAAMMVPRYFQTEVARASEAVSQLAVIRLGEENYNTANGSYLAIPAGTWAQIGIDAPSATGFFNYTVQTPAGGGFCVVGTRNANQVQPLHQGKTICMDDQWQYSGTHPNGPNPVAAAAPSACQGIC